MVSDRSIRPPATLAVGAGSGGGVGSGAGAGFSVGPVLGPLAGPAPGSGSGEAGLTATSGVVPPDAPPQWNAGPAQLNDCEHADFISAVAQPVTVPATAPPSSAMAISALEPIASSQGDRPRIGSTPATRDQSRQAERCRDVQVGIDLVERADREWQRVHIPGVLQRQHEA